MPQDEFQICTFPRDHSYEDEYSSELWDALEPLINAAIEEAHCQAIFASQSEQGAGNLAALSNLCTDEEIYQSIYKELIELDGWRGSLEVTQESGLSAPQKCA